MAWLLAGLVPWVGLAAEYNAGPVPEWVVATKPGNPTDGQLSKDSDGVSYLLVDTQIRDGKATSTLFRRVVSRALNPHGVESIANIEIEFDPSYQTLTLHAVDLVRDGRVIHKLGSAKVRVIERETELDARILDGMKSANIFLDDVRVGDVVDYAYSVSGRNPVFAGGTSGRISLQFSVPAARVHARVLVPEDKAVRVSTLYSSKKPSIRATMVSATTSGTSPMTPGLRSTRARRAGTTHVRPPPTAVMRTGMPSRAGRERCMSCRRHWAQNWRQRSPASQKRKRQGRTHARRLASRAVPNALPGC